MAKAAGAAETAEDTETAGDTEAAGDTGSAETAPGLSRPSRRPRSPRRPRPGRSGGVARVGLMALPVVFFGVFFAYPVAFKGGVRVAAGDVNGDGGPDIITGTGPGAAHVKAYAGSGLTEVHSFLPYGANFSGGVFVAAGDVNGDGAADIVTGADAGAGPHVKVFDGRTGAEFRSFFAYPVSFTGGVRVAAGDVNGDGVADIITGTGPGGGPHVKVFTTPEARGAVEPRIGENAARDDPTRERVVVAHARRVIDSAAAT